MLTGDNIDDSGYGIASIECRRGTLDNLDALNIVGVDKSEVVLSAYITMQALTVDEH